MSLALMIRQDQGTLIHLLDTNVRPPRQIDYGDNDLDRQSRMLPGVRKGGSSQVPHSRCTPFRMLGGQTILLVCQRRILIHMHTYAYDFLHIGALQLN